MVTRKVVWLDTSMLVVAVGADVGAGDGSSGAGGAVGVRWTTGTSVGAVFAAVAASGAVVPEG